MPTMEQINRLWATERELGLTAAHGHGSEHPDHILPAPDLLKKAFSGGALGIPRYDIEKQDIVMTPFPDADDKAASPSPA